MMMPFMSCSARLAIYTVFIASFFNQGGSLIIISLYLIGIFVALLTGWILQKTLGGTRTALIVDIPSYQWPKLRLVTFRMFKRVRSFITRAGKLIIPTSILLALMGHLDGQQINTAVNLSDSLLASIAKKSTWLFSPLGMSTEQWPMTVALIFGFFAKEVVIGALGGLFFLPLSNLSEQWLYQPYQNSQQWFEKFTNPTLVN